MESVIPPEVYTIWAVGLGVTLLVWVPIAVYSLHRTWRAAQSIRRYAADALRAAAGIVDNTRPIAALTSTIDVATDMVATATEVEKKLDAIAGLLASRVK